MMINRREFLKKAGLAASFSMMSSRVPISQAAVTGQKRRSVIIIMTDDQGLSFLI